MLRIPVSPTVSVPGSSTSGTYTIGWTGVADASSYTLREASGPATHWSEIYSGPSTSHGVTGRGVQTWSYQAKACNASGCSDWSATGVVSVQPAPLPTPTGLGGAGPASCAG